MTAVPGASGDRVVPVASSKFGPRPRPAIERFMEKVSVLPDGCWEWTGYRLNNGYGRFRPTSTTVSSAHRFSYQRFVGEIPDGLHIDHLCRNRACVNPAHLEAVTPRGNILRGVGFAAANARKSRCPQGHPYDEENTYVAPSGVRACRACRKASDLRYKARRAQEARA